MTVLQVDVSVLNGFLTMEAGHVTSGARNGALANTRASRQGGCGAPARNALEPVSIKVASVRDSSLTLNETRNPTAAGALNQFG